MVMADGAQINLQLQSSSFFLLNELTAEVNTQIIKSGVERNL